VRDGAIRGERPGETKTKKNESCSAKANHLEKQWHIDVSEGPQKTEILGESGGAPKLENTGGHPSIPYDEKAMGPYSAPTINSEISLHIEKTMPDTGDLLTKVKMPWTGVPAGKKRKAL